MGLSIMLDVARAEGFPCGRPAERRLIQIWMRLT
jgi:hypothetical protein